MQQPFFLADRAIISVSGADAEQFLNGILTASTLGLSDDAFRYGALLTPQGKVIADAMITQRDDAILLDCAAGAAPAFVKRLTLMKLRASVVIGQRDDLGVTVFDGFPDPRSHLAPRRRIGPRGSSDDAAPYHAARIVAGLPEQGADFAGEDVFPADINMDLLDGVDFKKGCFVGQEVVSRMKRRGTARRRTLKANVTARAQPGMPLLSGDFEIGLLTSISGDTALVRVRIDRLAEAEAKGETLTAAGAAVMFDHPHWLVNELAALAEAREAKA